jgi:cell division protein FtsQ
MPEQGADVLAHFGEDHFLERYQRYQAHIADWRQQYPHLAAVDLRYDNQVVLEMVSGKETAETSSGDAATPNPDAKPASDAKPSSAKPAATKISSAKPLAAKTSNASAPNKSKPAQDKKHAAPPKRAAEQSTTKRNSASTTHPATTTQGSKDRPQRSTAAIVAQGG